METVRTARVSATPLQWPLPARLDIPTGDAPAGCIRYCTPRPSTLPVASVARRAGSIAPEVGSGDAACQCRFDPRKRTFEVITVEDEEAFDCMRRLAQREGIFAGISSGAAVAGAVRAARELEYGTIVTIIADRGDRYLSTMLFRSTCAECPP